jgi:uncharacterized protein YecT (DUF1311 family)
MSDRQPRALRPQRASALITAVTLLVCAAANGVQAQGATAGDAIEAACADKTSNVELTQCMAEFAAKVDRDLNAVWQRVLASIDGAGHLTRAQRADWRAKLTTAQRHWIAFKTADCREPVGYEWFGGTGMSSAVSTCLARHTRDRTHDLRVRYLER